MENISEKSMQMKETRVEEFASLREFLSCFIAVPEIFPFIGSSTVIQKALTNFEPQRFL